MRHPEEYFLIHYFVGQDFDFSSNTQQFSAAISEEGAFFTKKRSDEDQQGD
jgi:hypothetical protein